MGMILRFAKDEWGDTYMMTPDGEIRTGYDITELRSPHHGGMMGENQPVKIRYAQPERPPHEVILSWPEYDASLEWYDSYPGGLVLKLGDYSGRVSLQEYEDKLFPHYDFLYGEHGDNYSIRELLIDLGIPEDAWKKMRDQIREVIYSITWRGGEPPHED